MDRPPRAKADDASERWPVGTLLARLGGDARRDLLAIAPPKRHPPDTVLLHQGENTSHVYVLRSPRRQASACVKVIARLANGTEGLLGIRVSGDVVGELAVIRHSARTATVVTCTPVITHAITHRDFLDFLRRHDEAWPALAGMIAERLEWANQRRLDFVGFPVPVRLARTLAELTDQHGYAVPGGIKLGVALSQEEFGKLIGARKDAVGKAVAQLKEAGLIVNQYRGIVVTDPDGLREYGEL
jgi:CRP/FNR family transcriptional regulator, cyclic AMP receptor protein